MNAVSGRTTDPADDLDERFRLRYTISGRDALLDAEYEAVGTDYQANGYMTREQADALGPLLGLGPGQVLLDLGAGCGWPGLYLASKHGCAVVSLDPIAEGVVTARRRALDDGLGDRSLALVASADPLPLRSASVDVVVHADLMC